MKKLDRKKIYIYQNDVPKSYEARQQFTDEVTKRGYTIVDSYDETVGLITCIGGDGTFLRLVHACDFPTSPIIGINTGHLGFFQEILPEDISGFLDSYEKQEYTLQNIWPIDAIIDTVNGTYQLRGVNEIVIRGPHTHLTTWASKSTVPWYRNSTETGCWFPPPWDPPPTTMLWAAPSFLRSWMRCRSPQSHRPTPMLTDAFVPASSIRPT